MQSDTNVPKNCWEFMGCPMKTRENCLVYKRDMGNDCWFFWRTNKESIAGRIGDGCYKCPWFKMNNSKNTALEIIH
jgi:hypothetical protein